MEELFFKSSAHTSIGVEMELQLLDEHTLDLSDGIVKILEDNRENSLIKPEFTQEMVEINSGICDDFDQLEADLFSLLFSVKRSCDKFGMVLSGGATHPFCSRLSKVTPVPRFLELEKLGGYLGHIQRSCSLHVHIGMTSGEETIALMKAIRPYLPVFIAISASSPFWWGYESGYASYRHRLLAQMRSYGLPPSFSDWEAFIHFFESAKRAGSIKTIKDVHWDLRPRPDMGTLEVRVMDAQQTVKDSITLASLVYLTATALKRGLGAATPEALVGDLPSWIEKENHFRASRSGLEADYIRDHRGNTCSISKVLSSLIEMVRDVATEMGLEERVASVEEFLVRGPSYQRQLEVYRERGNLKAVAAYLAAELAKELESREKVQSLSG